LNDFKVFLYEKGKIPEKYLPYYQRWVILAYRFVNREMDSFLTSDQIKAFLKSLATTHADWQMKQAEDALRFYQFFLKTIHDTNTADQPSFSTEWEMAVTKVRDVMRGKHRFYRTEQSYLKLIAAFRTFSAEKPPSQLSGADSQAFLSHLAVDR